MRNLKIILVDDNAQFRQSMKEVLEVEFSATIIAEASNGAEFLQLTDLPIVDIVLMDLSMPELNGVTTTQRYIYENLKAKVIAVTMFTDQAYLDQLIAAGFKGCIFKHDFFSEIKDAIQVVARGGVYFPKTIRFSEL